MPDEKKDRDKRSYVVLEVKPDDVYKRLGEFPAGGAEAAMRAAIDAKRRVLGTSGTLVAIPTGNWSAEPYLLEEETVTRVKFGDQPEAVSVGGAQQGLPSE